MSDLLYTVKDLLIALLRNNSFRWISAAWLSAERFSKQYCKFSSAPQPKPFANGNAAAFPALIWENM